LIPVIATLLSDVSSNTELEVIDQNGKYKRVKYISVFWLEMPGSYLANSIWNISYFIPKLNSLQSTHWSSVFGVLLAINVVQIIHSKKKTNQYFYVIHIWIMGLILLMLSIYRIIFKYF
jgi:hypothetical protein